eukprot:774987-Rhodomonas_salina.1
MVGTTPMMVMTMAVMGLAMMMKLPDDDDGNMVVVTLTRGCRESFSQSGAVAALCPVARSPHTLHVSRLGSQSTPSRTDADPLCLDAHTHMLAHAACTAPLHQPLDACAAANSRACCSGVR